MKKRKALCPVIQFSHGATQLPHVLVDSYNLALRDGAHYVGDKARKKALVERLEERLQEVEKPPRRFKEKPQNTGDIDAALRGTGADARKLARGATQDFAADLAQVVRRYRRETIWKHVTQIVIGGGLSDNKAGALAVADCNKLLRRQNIAARLSLIAERPDDAGLIGSLYLVPEWAHKGFDGMVAIDIGGSKIRVGIVQRAKKKRPARVVNSLVWEHAETNNKSRDRALRKMVRMIRQSVESARAGGLRVAPLIGIACPGEIHPDGTIQRGDQNLPGNWTHKRFNLPLEIENAVPSIGGYETGVVMHNDAVVQGLSELPRMRKHKRWGVLTIGTGLGNAAFTSRRS